jgi:Zn-dependent protease with chaperone function
MAAALLVFLYSVTVAWRVPSVLRRLTGSGVSARLGVAVWLTAMVSVLVSAGVSLALLIRAAVNGWSHLAEVVCRSVAGGACTSVVYRSALFELGLGIVAALATFATAVLIWRYGRRLQQAQRQTRAHAEVARVTGRRLPGVAGAGVLGTMVLDVPQLAAYCVPPGTIVVTSGALGILEPAQLTAVLAHERAHLAGRHHLLLALTKGLSATFPAVPLFAHGQGEIARLAEMAADDNAVRRAGRRPLIEALLAMGTGTAVPASALTQGPVAPGTAAARGTAVAPSGALNAAGYAVAARVERLLQPPPRARRTRYALALSCALIALPVLSAVIATLAISA